MRSNFDEKVAKHFDQIANNPGLFLPDVVEQIKTSCILAGAESQYKQHQQPRGKGRGRGNWNQDRDFFAKASGHNKFGGRGIGNKPQGASGGED